MADAPALARRVQAPESLHTPKTKEIQWLYLTPMVFLFLPLLRHLAAKYVVRCIGGRGLTSS